MKELVKSKSFLAIFLFFLIIGIITTTPYALAETYKIKNSNPRVVDAFGNPLTAKVNQQVQITSDVTNLQNIDQPFAFAVKIFKDGDMVSDSWITGSLAPGQTMNPAVSWTPSEAGTYNVQIFVLESIDNPVHLALPLLLIGLVVESSQPEITVSTDRQSYRYGDTIIISGFVQPVASNTPLTFQIFDPVGEHVQIGQADVAENGQYETTLMPSSLWSRHGTYTVKVQYGPPSVVAETRFDFTIGTNPVPMTDKIMPLILIPSDMMIETINASGTVITYKVKAIDDVDGIIKPLCNPSSGSTFVIGITKVVCIAKDSSGNSATASFTVTVKSSSLIIPDWVRNVAGFWCDGEIDDASFLEAIQYLIDNNVIIIPKTESGSLSAQEIPSWIKNNACWWASGQISNNDFASGIQYLISNGIIRV